MKITANGFSERLFASDKVIKINAAPPSDIELELAAVTEPSFAKAGLSCLIFSMSAFKGCSSVVITLSPFLVLAITGVISETNEPSSIAAFARFKDVIAKSSCCSLVN